MTIERRGERNDYLLVVDGVSLGRVKRGTASGGGRAIPGGPTRYQVWKIHGLQAGSQEEAERELIRRAQEAK